MATIPKFSISTRDWQVAPLAQVGGAAILGGGIFWFEFVSPSKSIREQFAFTAIAFGVGGSVGGANLTPGSPTPITVDDNFSVYDLNNSAGRLTVAGASLAVGYGSAIISAYNWGGSLFSSQEVGGWSAGVGAAAFTTIGMWHSMTLTAKALSP